jgi:hypothetical protein
MLMTGTGVFGLRCAANPDHIFNDTEALLASNPKRIAPQPRAPKIQPGTSEFIVRIPNGLIELLGKRFGQKLDSSVAALLGVMVDSNAFVVVGEDSKRLQDLLGKKIPSADVLVGSVYELKGDRDQWRQKAEQTASKAGSSESPADEMSGDFVQISIRIGMDTFMIVREKAKFNNMTNSQFIQQILLTATENNWL